MSQQEAEKQIARILRDLEIATDTLVDEVNLSRIDITQMMDKATQHVMTVTVNLRRKPGHEWGQAE
jgi:hypothetical protein